jgi:hypothetical protein
MTRRCRLAALHLAIAAMLLRALLPAGWMPDSTGAAAFTICTMDGAGHHAEEQSPGKPVPADSQHAHEECPFAAAHHVAAPVVANHLVAPSLAGRAAGISHPVAAFVPIAKYEPHSPRAPPHFA